MSILVLSLTPLLWFKKDSIMIGHDLIFPLNPIIFFTGRLFTWISHSFGQSQALIMGTIPIHFIDIIPSLLGFNLQTTEKIVYVFWFFTMGVSAYILASTINNKSRIFKFTALIFYQFNSFILQGWFIGERTKFSAYVAFPLVLAVFIRVYRKELSIFRGAVYNTLILFIFNGGGLFGTPLFGGYFVSLIIFILFFSILSFLRRQYGVIKRLFLLTLLSSFGFFLANAYYILPALSELSLQFTKGMQITGGVEGLINWASEISANTSFINLFRLQGIPEWYDNSQHPYAHYYFASPFLIAVSYLWPLLIFLTILIIKKKDKLEIVFYLFLVYLLGIFFVGGTHPPLGFLYAFLMKSVPGFTIFRTPYYKFAPAIFLASAFLIAFFIDHFQGKAKRIIFIIFVVIVLVYNFPYFTGNFFEWRKDFSTRNNVPSYIFEFGKWAEENVGSDRILILPSTAAGLQYDVYRWGYLSLQSLPTLLTNKSVVIDDNTVTNEEAFPLYTLYRAIESKDQVLAEKIMNMLRAKYILLKKDVAYNLGWENININNPYTYKTILINNFHYRLIKTFGEWEVYSGNINNSKISLMDKADLLDGQVYNTADYFNLISQQPEFYLKQDKDILRPIDLSTITSSNTYLPQCISCRFEQSPMVQFPERLVLPDSPFYSLVILNEKRKLVETDTKSSIYDYLGLTTKRISEIKTSIIQGKSLKKSVIDLYAFSLARIGQKFKNISGFRDKFESAQMISYYLNAELRVIRDLFSLRIVSDDNKPEEEISSILNSIADLRGIIMPYIFKTDLKNDKLFYSEIGKQGEYEVLLRKSDLEKYFKEKISVTLKVDNGNPKNLEINLSANSDNLIVIDTIDLSNSNHTFLLNLPDLPNLAKGFDPDNLNVGVNGDIQCYSSKINTFDRYKTYKISFNIPAILENKLYFYIKRKDATGEKLLKIIKYQGAVGAGSEILEPNSGAQDTSVGFCAESLDKNVLNNELKLNITEAVDNALILKSSEREKINVSNVSFTQINPTKYTISFHTDKPEILSFAEQFDSRWKLSLFEGKHFRLNGYANAWFIDKPGTYKLTLEYSPQKLFYYGSIITLITLLFSICIVLKRRENTS